MPRLLGEGLRGVADLQRPAATAHTDVVADQLGLQFPTELAVAGVDEVRLDEAVPELAAIYDAVRVLGCGKMKPRLRRLRLRFAIELIRMLWETCTQFGRSSHAMNSS